MALNENLSHLIKVTAINIGKNTIFKDALEKEDKVRVLDDLKLPDRIIALIIGSTQDSVRSLRLRSKKKARLKNVQPSPDKKGE